MQRDDMITGQTWKLPKLPRQDKGTFPLMTYLQPQQPQLEPRSFIFCFYFSYLLFHLALLASSELRPVPWVA
jgi:hypothetical protein